MFAPIRPSPIIPICMAIVSYVFLRSSRSSSTGTRACFQNDFAQFAWPTNSPPVLDYLRAFGRLTTEKNR